MTSGKTAHLEGGVKKTMAESKKARAESKKNSAEFCTFKKSPY